MSKPALIFKICDTLLKNHKLCLLLILVLLGYQFYSTIDYSFSINTSRNTLNLVSNLTAINNITEENLNHDGEKPGKRGRLPDNVQKMIDDAITNVLTRDLNRTLTAKDEQLLADMLISTVSLDNPEDKRSEKDYEIGS